MQLALRAGAAALAALVVLAIACNVWVVFSTRADIYDSPQRLPWHAVGLVLGTSPYRRGGGANPFFVNRVAAAARLYHAGRVDRLLVSGANPSRYYNEPRAMFKALVARGVPASAITLDFAGFRTLDSVVRARRVFGQTRLTIISQRFHDYRALFIARYTGINAVAFAAAPVAARQAFWAHSREFFARVRAVLDLFVLHAGPRFLGSPVSLDMPSPDHPGTAASESLHGRP